MSYQYVTVNGQRVEKNVAAAFKRMAADFKKRFGLTLRVRGGVRTRAEQLHFYNLYRQGRGNLALHPDDPLAYHVESNPRGPRALDIEDSGKDKGVSWANNERSNWIRQNAHLYGFDPAGYRFSQAEPWHIEYTRALAPQTSKPSGSGASGSKKPPSNTPNYPKVSLNTIARIGDVRGLQKIARLNGGNTKIDNKWGPQSKKGFKRFLKRYYGGSILTWLRKRWGYVGDDRQGPVMEAALKRANAENFRAL